MAHGSPGAAAVLTRPLFTSDADSYAVILRKMALVVSIASAKEDVRLLQARRVAEEKIIERTANRPARAIVSHIETSLEGWNLTADELDVLEEVSEEAVGAFVLEQIEGSFVAYAGWLTSLTFKPANEWSLTERLLDAVVRVKAFQFRQAMKARYRATVPDSPVN